MFILILGIGIFVGVHLVPTLVSLRQQVIIRWGVGTYKKIFAVIALTGLVLIVIGKSRADFYPLWQPPAWGRNAALVLMAPAFIFLAAANMPSNIKRWIRHPMLWGVTLWSVGHLLANGDLASLVLFGSLGVFALLDMVSANLRGATRQHIRYPGTKDATVVAAGLVAYAALLFLHPYLFGAAIL